MRRWMQPVSERLDGGVNQTLAPAHGVEEVLGRTQALDKRGLNEAAGLSTVSRTS